MADDEQVTVRDNGQGRFEVLVDDVVAGFAAYHQEGAAIAVTHVEVDDRHEGQGIGTRLVAAMLAQARERGTSLLPYCPFVQAYLGKHPDERDVVPAAERARFGLT